MPLRHGRGGLVFKNTTILIHLTDDALEQLRQDLSRVALEEEISAGQVPRSVGVRVHDGDPGAPPPRLARVPGGGVDGGRGPDDDHEVDAAPHDPVLDLHQHELVERLAEPDDAGPQQPRLAARAVRQVLGLDRRHGHVRVQQRHRLVGRVVLRGRRERGAHRVR